MSHGKQLKFDNQVVGEPTKCVSYISTPTGDTNLVSPLPQYYNGPLQLVYNAFGLPALPSISTGQILSRHLFTSSTPVTKPSREKNSLNKTNTNVTITVEYPSKTVNKTLTSEFEGSILLKQRNNHMSATAIVIGLLLKTKSIEATLNRFRPKADIYDIPNIIFLSSVVDQRQQRLNYTVLVSRILSDYFDAFAEFKDVCVKHIPHKYSKEMSEKSDKTPLGIIFKNENVNDEMLSILQQFHKYLPDIGEDKFDGELFAGDQLTVERAVNIISSVSNGYSAEARLEGMHFQLGDWHAAVKFLD
ncbi:Hypothetical predicted protein, partial [Paramuricea clavata]